MYQYGIYEIVVEDQDLTYRYCQLIVRYLVKVVRQSFFPSFCDLIISLTPVSQVGLKWVWFTIVPLLVYDRTTSCLPSVLKSLEVKGIYMTIFLYTFFFFPSMPFLLDTFIYCL